MERKKFSQDYDPFAHYHARDQFMLFYTGTADNILGFTKQKRYRYQEDNYASMNDHDYPDLAGLESVIHANTVPISDLTLDLELEWAWTTTWPTSTWGRAMSCHPSTRPTTGVSSGGLAPSGAPIKNYIRVCVGGILGSRL